MKKQIVETPTYRKSYIERIKPNLKLKKATREAKRLFDEDRSNPDLNDHALENAMAGLRSFTISKDTRIIYLETADKIVFLNIGTHKEVYIR